MANFTPQEIEEILQQFFNVTGKRQYIGARYIPIFGRKNEQTIQWDGGVAPYEPLTIVLYQGNSYTSRTYVPIGVDILNQDYWALTGNYNAQVEAYREEVLSFNDRITTTENNIDTLESLLPNSDFSAVNTVKKYIDDSIATTQSDIDTLESLLPNSDFSAVNTVKKYIDDRITSLDNEKLIYVTPEMYGAKGDGATDDTLAFQTMLADIENNATIVLSGNYHISDTLILKPYTKLTSFGNDEYLPLLYYTGTNPIFIDGSNCSGCKIENVCFSSTQTSTANPLDRTHICFKLDFDNTITNGNIDWIVNNCNFSGFLACFTIKGRNLTLNNCLLSTCTSCLDLYDTSVITDIRGYVVKNCRFHSMATCFRAYIPRNINCFFEVSNCTFDFCTSIVSGLTIEDTAHPFWCTGFVFKNNLVCNFVVQNGILFYVDGIGLTDSFGITIANNIFDGSNNLATIKFRELFATAYTGTYAIIKGNIIKNFNINNTNSVISVGSVNSRAFLTDNVFIECAGHPMSINGKGCAINNTMVNCGANVLGANIVDTNNNTVTIS